MRTISEKLQLNKQTTILKEYKYFPKDVKQLQAIIRQKLDESKDADLNDIDVSKITNLSYAFWGYDPYNIKINEWDVSKVTSMDGLFKDCSHLNCDMSMWDISNVQFAEEMFNDCLEFEGQGLNKWKPLSLKNATGMFFGCKKFTEDLSQWKTDSFSTTSNMFVHCHELDFNVKNWNMTNAIHMDGMFYHCTNFTGKGLDAWKLNKKADTSEMFDGCDKMQSYPKWYKG